MKNLISVFTFAAAALAMSLTACSNDDNLTDGTPTGAQPIILKTSISNASTRSVSQTIQDTAFEDDAKVGVFVTASSTEDATWSDLANTEATVESGYINLGSDVAYPTDGASVSIVAYAPYTSGATLGELTFAVQTDQSSDDNYIASDLLYAPAVSANSESAEVDLTFNHKLAKINVTFDGDEASEYAPGKTVTIKDVETQAKIDLSTGEITNVTGNTSDVTAAKYEDDATVYTASAIVAPQTVSALTVTIGSQTYTLCGTSLELKSGYRYNLTASIDSADDNATGYLQLESVVNDWEDYSPDNYVFDLTAIDANLLSDEDGDNSWDSSTSTLTLSQYGQGGWYFADGLNLSSYGYLVVELGDSYESGEDQLRLYSTDSIWETSATFTISDKTVVIDLDNQANQLSEGTAADTSSIYYVAFWAYDDNDIVINSIYATNYPPCEPCGTTTPSND